MKRFLCLALLLSFLSAPSSTRAQETPVEISAAKSLEWNRKAKTYTARGDARAKQGALEISADVLSATYSEAGGGTDISRLSAAGNVVIVSPPYTAVGDRADYDLASGQARLTGNNLKISTATETLTARDSIDFSTAQNRLTANGNAVALRSADRLSADVLTADFSRDAAGKMALQKMTATSNVTIRTARETVTGDRGVYDVAAGKATLTGKIVITQGGSRIEGSRAEVDLKTGISQLFAEGSTQTQGRVKGVFYPKAKAAPQ